MTPWGKLHKLIEPFYPNVEGAGCPPSGSACVLRMYVAQQCFGLSNEAIEDAIFDSQAYRAFVGIDLARESAPEATAALKFRHLLEAKELIRQIFATINGDLSEKGLIKREETIVDRTVIAAAIDQEQGWHARSGDARIEEWQRRTLPDESAHRR